MKSWRLVSVLMVLVACTAYYFLRPTQSLSASAKLQENEERSAQTGSVSQLPAATKDPARSGSDPAAKSDTTPTSPQAATQQNSSKPNDLKPEERAALTNYAGTLYEFSRKGANPKSLIQRLTQQGLKPEVAQDFNKETGKLLVVRTEETLPGTRYFHAQFFEDENKQPFLQHMSFEFRPGPESMKTAVDAVQEKFPGLGRPESQSDGYVLWKTQDGYVVWVKKMSAQDLKHDPFNAYAPEDVDTVRVVVEQDIHSNNDDSHTH